LVILTQALKDCGALGVGQTPLAEDINDAFTKLNWMIAQWNRKRFFIYHLVDLAVTSTGANIYTIGPGGNIDVAVRPDKLEAAFVRQLVQSQPNQVDYPLRLIQSFEDYSRIALKELKSFPNAVFYDPKYPLGELHAYPVMQAGLYALHVVVKAILPKFTSLYDEIILPDEYYAALHLNMTVRLGPTYKFPSDPTVVALAKDALNVLRGANTAIASLVMPAGLIRPGIYNPYSDQIR